ncbi:restriction endonuclease [Streptomyces californicus]|uniref:restriction endonuclease n=1 Tax=Streptomyces californicus TaxID=67351 RepID=UPI0037A2BFC2
MAAGEGQRVRVGASSLLAEFKQLGALPSAHKRGYRLEVLLEQLFRRAHFRVDRNASVAKPRQTDLVARYGDTWYLIEVKWHNEPADISVFDSVRSRMERAASSAVVGVIISVNGFTDSAVEDLRGTPGPGAGSAVRRRGADPGPENTEIAGQPPTGEAGRADHPRPRAPRRRPQAPAPAPAGHRPAPGGSLRRGVLGGGAGGSDDPEAGADRHARPPGVTVDRRGCRREYW